jgi:hypothetical protein
MQDEFPYTIRVVGSLAVPTTVSNQANNLSNVFDRETDTIWSPTLTGSSRYTVAVQIPQAPLFRGVAYYAYGDGIHDANRLEVLYLDNSNGQAWQIQNFTLKTGSSAAQFLGFRTVLHATNWTFRMVKSESSSEPLWLREINMIWSVSCTLCGVWA